jgi:hypothetical protein
MVFLVADQLLIFDRVAQTLTVLVNAAIDEAASPTDAYESSWIGDVKKYGAENYYPPLVP